MTLRTAYSLGLSVTLCLALLVVLIGGEMPTWAWFALLWPVRLGITLVRGSSRVGNATLGTLIAVAGFLWGAALVVIDGLSVLLPEAAIALGASLVGRVEGRSNLHHDLQALLLSLLLIFAGAGLNSGISYGIIFVLYALAAAWALLARQLWISAAREAARERGIPEAVTLARRDLITPRFAVIAGTTALLVLFSTTVVFVLFPRVGLGNLAFLASRRAGLPEAVYLDSQPRALGGREVMARVKGVSYSIFARGLYLRVETYDKWTKLGFVHSPAADTDRFTDLGLAASAGIHVYDVFMRPVTGTKLATLGPVERVRITAGGATNPSLLVRVSNGGITGEVWALSPIVGPVRYTIAGAYQSNSDEGFALRANAEGAAEAFDLSHSADPRTQRLSRFRELPSSLDERIRSLTHQVVGEARAPAAKVARLARYLRDNYAYSLEQSNAEKADPLAGFLFEDRRGHCEFFAAALATMLREAGVAARVVGGFAGGYWDRSDDLILFTAADAHAWVEWFDASRGWVIADATPPSGEGPRELGGIAAMYERLVRWWDYYVVDYGLTDQLALIEKAWEVGPGRPAAPRFSSVKMPALGALACLGCLVVAVVYARRGRRRWHSAGGNSAGLARALEKACRRVLERPVLASETLRTAVEAASRLLSGAHRQLLEEAARAYEEARFGGVEPTRGRVSQLVRELRRTSLRHSRDRVRGHHLNSNSVCRKTDTYN